MKGATSTTAAKPLKTGGWSLECTSSSARPELLSAKMIKTQKRRKCLFALQPFFPLLIFGGNVTSRSLPLFAGTLIERKERALHCDCPITHDR